MKPAFIVLILVALVAVIAAVRFGLKYKIRSTDPAMEDRIADNVVTGDNWAAGSPNDAAPPLDGGGHSPFERTLDNVQGASLASPIEFVVDGGAR